MLMFLNRKKKPKKETYYPNFTNYAFIDTNQRTNDCEEKFHMTYQDEFEKKFSESHDGGYDAAEF